MCEIKKYLKRLSKNRWQKLIKQTINNEDRETNTLVRFVVQSVHRNSPGMSKGVNLNFKLEVKKIFLTMYTQY